MNYQEKCECCWNIVTAYCHKINASMCSALEKAINAFVELKRPLNLQNDLDLTKNQYNNFQKLQYFWLVDRVEGWRKPTHKARYFIRWLNPVQNRVATLWKKVLPENHPARDTDKQGFKLVYIDSVRNEKKYKKRDEYVKEKTF